MKWLITAARKRNEKSMALRLAQEVLAASKEEGAAVKKRVDTHKMQRLTKRFHTLDFDQKMARDLRYTKYWYCCTH